MSLWHDVSGKYSITSGKRLDISQPLFEKVTNEQESEANVTPQGVVIKIQCVISSKISKERNLHGLYIQKEHASITYCYCVYNFEHRN